MTPAVPQFGPFKPEAEYVLRPGGCAVIFRPPSDIATVRTPSGLALPGGGQNAGESPEEAAIRESLEEGGLRIGLGRCIGVADELVFAEEEGKHYRKRCTFFLADVIGTSKASQPEHELVWLGQNDAASMLRDESQRRAVLEALRLKQLAE